jgi:membrane fusion protein (multidrug efflux system)
MSVAFSRTLRSVNVDQYRASIVGILLTSVLIAIWIGWLLLARVSVYAVSDAARLEAERAIHPVQPLHTGRITTNHLILGQEVKRGDVLIELDATVQHLQLVEERTQSDAATAELERLQQAIAAEYGASQEEQKAAEIGIQEARAKLREAEAVASYAVLDADRKSKLHDAGLLSELDFAHSTAEAQKQRAAVESLQLAVSRQDREQRAHLNERRSRIEALRRDASRLEGLKTKSGATVDRLQTEMDLRRIVAPIDGKIGEVLTTLRVGSVVSAGERLGAIIPSGKLKVVAQFPPATALGRIRNGQPARVRFEGFPWTQYGTLSATVVNVANEVRDGYVRVELSPSPGCRIPLEHGLPGATEIEVERLSPLTLLLRTAGRTFAPQQREPKSRQDSPQAVEGQSR